MVERKEKTTEFVKMKLILLSKWLECIGKAGIETTPNPTAMFSFTIEGLFAIRKFQHIEANPSGPSRSRFQ